MAPKKMPKDVSQWLDSLGLSQHAASMDANDISLDLLPELTHDLLEKIGVTSIGHRLRILKAAVELGSAGPAPTAVEAVAQPVIAERRQLTVMFCDLVDSTRLSTQLDPEYLREVVQAYQQAAGEVIARFDGHIAQYLGDGLLVYFGYPQAHENDAERAVYAGLGIPVAMAALNVRLQRDYSIELAVRIGIHTGPVVVGQMGGDLRQENLALGETPNLAARLEGLALADSVMISESTRRLLGEKFVLEALGPQALKGISELVPVFSVRAERLSEMRFSADQASAGAIVGRDTDLDLLKQCWQRAEAGQGQFVLLTGGAGIGKSRVVSGLTDALAGTTHVRLTYQCSPFHIDTALYPAFTQLKRAAAIEAGDSKIQQLDKLEALLYKGSNDISLAAPLLGSMMGMGQAVRERYGELQFSPNEQRSKALLVLSEQLISLANKSPVLFIIEDAHWIDPSTQALTEFLLKTIAGHRVLLLVTTRPGFEDNYGEQHGLTRITLERLTLEQAALIIKRMAHGKKFPAELIDEILAKADGVPLFVEEITKTVLESGGLIETDDAFELTGTSGRLAVPSSLQDSLMARLDKLQSIKVVAQTAACIGRDFGFPMLNAVLPMAKNSLALALDKLVASELICAQGEPPAMTYSFKHALVRDAAYESQLKARRQQVHRDIFNELETEAAAPQVLAHHAMKAGLAARAVHYWTLAADFAFSQPAYLEAISSYEHALKALGANDSLEQSEESQREELSLTTKLIRALSAGRGSSHPDTVAATRNQYRLQEQVGDASQRFAVMLSSWSANIATTSPEQLLIQLDELCAEAERNADGEQQMIAYRLRGFNEMRGGRFAAALQEFERSLTFYDPGRDKETMQRYGIHNGIAARCSTAFALTGSGLGGRAGTLLDGLVQAARDLKVPATLGFALFSMASIYQVGRWPNSRAFALQALQVTEDYQLVSWAANLQCVVGGVMLEEGEFSEAAEFLVKGIAARRKIGGHTFMAHNLAQYAACLLALGRPAAADKAEQEALSMLENGSEQWPAAEIHRLLAQAHFQSDGQREVAIERLERAIKIAREQTAVLFELRATVTLAEILSESGATEQAKAILQPVVQAYPGDGHSMADYVCASELLTRISGMD